MTHKEPKTLETAIKMTHKELKTLEKPINMTHKEPKTLEKPIKTIKTMIFKLSPSATLWFLSVFPMFSASKTRKHWKNQ